MHLESETWRNGRKAPYQVLDVSPLAGSHGLENVDLRGFIIKNISALNHLENLTYNAIKLDGSRLFDDAEESTRWLVYDSLIFKDY